MLHFNPTAARLHCYVRHLFFLFSDWLCMKNRQADARWMMKLIKVLSNTIKQKRMEKAGKWDVPLSKVRLVAEDEMFKVIRTGKRKTKQWKRMITKVTFVGQGFTRKPPKYERFIRPSGIRFTKAHVTHPELKCTFNIEMIGVKKNTNGPMYTSLGVVTKGTIIETQRLKERIEKLEKENAIEKAANEAMCERLAAIEKFLKMGKN